MNGIYSFIIAISMYSKIPMPTVEWTRERMSYVMCFFPVVGLIQGVLFGLWFYGGLKIFMLSPVTVALAGACIPVLITGGIHMDGFVDTVDALHSYGDRARKLQILKDPHLGAFALIYLAVYMFLYLGAVYEYAVLVNTWAGKTNPVLYGLPVLVFVMERVFSGLSVVCLPSAKKDGLAAGFAQTAKKKFDRAVLALWLVLCAGAGLAAWVMGFKGAGCLTGVIGAAQLLILWRCCKMAMKEFGGLTGDLAGYFLQICELASLWLLVIFIKAGGMGI